MNTPAIVEGGQTSPTRQVVEPASGAPLTLVPVFAGVLLLFVALSVNGAYAVRYWAPITLFLLVVLASAARRRLSGPALVAAAGIWLLAVWSLASALWGESPESAVEGGAQTLLYAALFALPLLALRDRRSVKIVAAATLVGLALVTLGTLVEILFGGESAFLAGRLNDPVGYRNGTAALFVLAFWPLLCLAATRGVSALLRAPAFACALVALGLALLTQSRGALLGFVIGGAIAVLVGPDRMRRAWLTVVALGAIALASGSLLAPYHAFVDGKPGADAVADAGLMLTLLAAMGLVAVLVLAVYDNGLRGNDPSRRVLRGLTRGALATLVVVAGVGAFATIGNPASFVRDKYDEFKVLDTNAPASTRLGSTGGQRYDLWRIALREFEQHPVGGVGEGSYRFGYYRERNTDRNLSTPHGLPMALLSETGAVGGSLFVLFLGAIVAMFVVRWRDASLITRRWATSAAAAGAVLVGQCLVDWLWRIPGLAGLGMLALGLAVAVLDMPDRAPAAVDGRARIPAAVGTLVLMLAIVPVASVYLADFHVRQSRARGEQSATRQLASARTAARLNPIALTPKLLQAGALEELGRRAEARDALQAARRLEPRNFVIYGLIGDLETRAGNRPAAHRAYRRALQLNPADVGLLQLTRRTA